MSEEILKAILQLFAIIVKQKGGVSDEIFRLVKRFLESQLPSNLVDENFKLFQEYCKESSNNGGEEKPKKKSKRQAFIEQLKAKDAARKQAKDVDVSAVDTISLTDSVTTLFIAKKINKTLTSKQKTVVVLRCLELMNSNVFIWSNRIDIIETVSAAFNIDRFDFDEMKVFVNSQNSEDLLSQNVLVINDLEESHLKHLQCNSLEGEMLVQKIVSNDLLFLKYCGEDDLLINGVSSSKNFIHVLAPGSSIRTVKSHTVFYSDINAKLLNIEQTDAFVFKVDGVTHRFRSGKMAIYDVNFEVDQGKMIGILGASGSGKTTLINILSGIEKPEKGKVSINGYDLHSNELPTGVIGMIPQDDLLIEDLTVYQNLYYALRLSVEHMTDDEQEELLTSILKKIGLFQTRHLKVGNAVNKTISGGQRKRLNIALELLREPKVLFVDEPTSGLSSRDSEMVMDILRELSLKGKLVFSVIHQPSSNVFKVFDKILLLDEGGVPIYFGNPIQAIQFFQDYDSNIQNESGECNTCGNVEPEVLFEIVESKVVNEFGEHTEKRKVAPLVWKDRFEQSIQEEKSLDVPPIEVVGNKPPSKLSQFRAYVGREFQAKIANRQYLLINLLEAPLLAMILASIIRFNKGFDGVYSFGDNMNISAYFFIGTIVAIFMGLSVSAEEIVKDSKILKREKFLHLSKMSYLLSKVGVLFLISAIQTLSFVLIGNWILEIQDMHLPSWLVLFSASCFANILGLNISASFNSAVTVYIMIPLLLIPQMILSGAMFSFDNLNRYVGSIDKVPLVADLMVSRWSFESLMVEQFKNNQFERLFYDLEKVESNADYNQVYRLPYLKGKAEAALIELGSASYQSETSFRFQDLEEKLQNSLLDKVVLLQNELRKEKLTEGQSKFVELLAQDISNLSFYRTLHIIDSVELNYRNQFLKANDAISAKEYEMQYTKEKLAEYNAFKKSFENGKLSNIVKKSTSQKQVIEKDGELVQIIDPIFKDPEYGNWRAHFFTATKFIGSAHVSTYVFNLLAVWLLSLFAFVALYFDLLAILVRRLMKLSQLLNSIKL